MKIIIKGGNNNTYEYDTKEEPICLVFENDEERLGVIKHLKAMKPAEGKRVYCIYPDNEYTEKEIKKFVQESKNS